MESGKILMAIEERRKWEIREKEILEKLEEIKKEREEILRVISDTKKKIAELDATLGSRNAPSQKGVTPTLPGGPAIGHLTR